MSQATSYMLISNTFKDDSKLKSTIIFQNNNFILTNYSRHPIEMSKIHNFGPLFDQYLSDIIMTVDGECVKASKIKNLDSVYKMINTIIEKSVIDSKLSMALCGLVVIAIKYKKRIDSLKFYITISEDPLQYLKEIVAGIEYNTDIGKIDEETKYRIIKDYKSELKVHRIFNDSRDFNIFLIQLKRKMTSFIENELEIENIPNIEENHD